jgi:hypothetical protein
MCLAASVLLVGLLMADSRPAQAAWPFADDSSLPLLVDDAAPGSASASYRLVVAGDAPFVFEVAAHTRRGRFTGGLIALWNINDPSSPSMYAAVTTLTSTTRVRVASDTLAVNMDTEPLPPADNTALLIEPGTLSAGTYEVVMLVSGEQPNADSLFRIRAGAGVNIAASSFGRAMVAGEEAFHGVANVTAADSNAILDGTLHAAVTRSLTGIFLAPDAVATYTGPDGTHVATPSAKFAGAAAGAYDLTIAAGADPSSGGFPPGALFADIALAGHP